MTASIAQQQEAARRVRRDDVLHRATPGRLRWPDRRPRGGPEHDPLGKFRPFILFVAVPLLFLSFLTFRVPTGLGDGVI